MLFEEKQELNERLLNRYQEENPNASDEARTNSHFFAEDERVWIRGVTIVLMTATAICTLVLIWILQRAVVSKEIHQLCENGHTPLMRREWRDLTGYERNNYLSALECLLTTPSRIHTSHAAVTRWYDFAWSHYHVGYIAHDAACFLSWHRWFLVLFENSLRNECGYSGALPYWDWTLDWQHPERAPVFDADNGLGGNGNATSASLTDGGWCVTEGLFAGARIPFDFDAVPQEQELHNGLGKNSSFCLSREFAQDNTFNGSHLSPQHISKVLSKHEYVEFLAALEFGPHNDIPFGVQGTFLTLYAPADPIFWLHHAQLDRLWWIWQHAKPGHAMAYHGPSTSRSNASARLSDRLPFDDLSEDVVVGTIIDTKKGRLCYAYERSEL